MLLKFVLQLRIINIFIIISDILKKYVSFIKRKISLFKNSTINTITILNFYYNILFVVN